MLMVKMEGESYVINDIIKAVDALGKKLDSLKEDVNSLNFATEQYKQIVIGLTKRFDDYEEERERKCYARLSQIEHGAKDIQYDVRSLKEKMGDIKTENALQCKKVEYLDNSALEMDARFTSFTSAVNSQLSEIKDIVTTNREVHQKNEKEINEINLKFDRISWVFDLGAQFKKSVIAIILSMFLVAMGIYFVGYKVIFSTKENTLTKQELLDALKQEAYRNPVTGPSKKQ